jgi:hypothetical protein
MYRLCVKVNSIICMESLGVGISGHACSRATPLTYKMSSLRAGSHYGRPSREAMRLSGQTLLRVQRNELKIANKI